MPTPFSRASARRLPRRHRLSALLLAGAVLAALTGCSESSGVASDYRPPTNSDGTSVDGRVVEIDPAERGAPVVFEGVSEWGDPLRSSDYPSRVYVVNFWYAACGPCRIEAPLLEEVWQKHQGDEVGFVGVNIYDQPDTAIAFAKTYGVTYPSIIDVDSGATKLAFAAATPIQATPTTLVMDRQGRVAARIIGQLPSASILSTLIGDALQEGP